MSYVNILSADPVMRRLMQTIGESPADRIRPNGRVREYLIRAIISQQLSTWVAEVIQGRFLDLYGGRFPSARRILETDIGTLRAAGLSNGKASYIRNIAAHFEENGWKNADFADLQDEDIIERLTAIKGVGRWTVEMVLMFCLGRPDVFPLKDYGIRTAMVRLYGLGEGNRDLEKKMCAIAEKWRPCRTTACLYLWAYKDLKRTS